MNIIIAVILSRVKTGCCTCTSHKEKEKQRFELFAWCLVFGTFVAFFVGRCAFCLFYPCTSVMHILFWICIIPWQYHIVPNSRYLIQKYIIQLLHCYTLQTTKKMKQHYKYTTTKRYNSLIHLNKHFDIT